MKAFKRWWQIIQCAFRFHDYEYFVVGPLSAVKTCTRCSHSERVLL